MLPQMRVDFPNKCLIQSLLWAFLLINIYCVLVDPTLCVGSDSVLSVNVYSWTRHGVSLTAVSGARATRVGKLQQEL